MKYAITTVAVVAAAALAGPAVAQASSYSDAILADDPLTYLRMQEATAGVVQDASPNDRDGTLAGAAALTAPGPFVAAGTALALSSNGTVSADVPTQSRSVQLWVKPNRLRRGQQAGFVAHGDPATTGWALGLGAKRKLTFVTGDVTIASKVSLPAEAWSMLTVSWDAGKVRFFVNGGAMRPSSFSVAAPTSADAGMVLGGSSRGAFTGAFAGSMDEVALFAQPLSASDAQDHFAAAQVPVNTAPVTVGGTPVVDSPISANPGVWTSIDGQLSYQWQRCDADGDDCDDIEGATASTYLVTAADACSTLRVVETRTNAAGSTTTVSEASAVIPGPCPGETTTGSETGTTGGETGGSTGGETGDTGTTGTAPSTTSTTDTGAAAGAVTGTPVTTVQPSVSATTCLKLVKGRRTVKLRGLGTLRLRVARPGCIKRGAPLRVSFAKAKGKQLKSVRYRLAGKAVRIGKRRGYVVKLAKPRVRVGGRVLKVRVAPRSGRARTVTLRLRFARA